MKLYLFFMIILLVYFMYNCIYPNENLVSVKTENIKKTKIGNIKGKKKLKIGGGEQVSNITLEIVDNSTADNATTKT